MFREITAYERLLDGKSVTQVTFFLPVKLGTIRDLTDLTGLGRAEFGFL